MAPTPVNVVVGTMEGPVSVADLRKAGVRRISMGAALYGRVMADLRVAAAQLADGDMASASEGMGFRGILAMIRAAG